MSMIRAVAFVVFFVSLSMDDIPIADEWLLVATPGVRNYLEYGGHGLLVFDVESEHRFVKRIPLQGFDAEGKPSNVKGICGSQSTQRIYVKHTQDVAMHRLHHWQTAVGKVVLPAACDRCRSHLMDRRFICPV